MLEGVSSSLPGSVDLKGLVASLLQQSGLSQRELGSRSGLSKDQLSRTFACKRPVELGEALALLDAAEMPGRGAITLALFERSDLAVEWSRSGLSEFLETLIRELPEALLTELGDSVDRINPRWGRLAARFVAQRIAHHVQEITDREAQMAEFKPALSRALG